MDIVVPYDQVLDVLQESVMVLPSGQGVKAVDALLVYRGT